MRFAHAVLLCATATGAAAQEREPAAQRIARLMAALRVEAEAPAAIDALVELGNAAVPALAEALEVLPADTLDNQGWKEGVLAVLERLGPDARDAGADLLVAAFKLPLTLSESAFAALATVGPAAHVRLDRKDIGIGTSATINGVRIPGTGERAKVISVLTRMAKTSQVLQMRAMEQLNEVQQWLARPGERDPTTEELERWTPLLQDMTRQALVTVLGVPDLKQESDALAAARALVRWRGPLPAAEEAHAFLLLTGTADEQLAAARALGHSKTTSRHVVRALRAVLGRADARIVREAITALGMAGGLAAPAAAELKQLTTHGDPQIAARASAALRAIGR